MRTFCSNALACMVQRHAHKSQGKLQGASTALFPRSAVIPRSRSARQLYAPCKIGREARVARAQRADPACFERPNTKFPCELLNSKQAITGRDAHPHTKGKREGNPRSAPRLSAEDERRPPRPLALPPAVQAQSEATGNLCTRRWSSRVGRPPSWRKHPTSPQLEIEPGKGSGALDRQAGDS